MRPSVSSDQASDLSSRVPSVLPVQRGQFYGGSWHQRADAQRLASINPSTGEVLAEVDLASPAEVDAVDRATGPDAEPARRDSNGEGRAAKTLAEARSNQADDALVPARAMGDQDGRVAR